MNRLQLDAVVVEREAVRYTPAGVPMLALQLQHAAEVVEAGMPRRIEMSVSALVAGALVDAVQHLEFGQKARFAGFLAPRFRQAKTLVFHITELQDIGKD